MSLDFPSWKSRAALASELAADIYGLKVLARHIEDHARNTTRFLIMARDPDYTRRGEFGMMTSFVFRVRNIPAALYKAMGGFATNSVNMTKLESYMVDGEFTATRPKFLQREAVIARSARAPIEDLDEGVGITPEEDAGDDGVGLGALSIHQLEVPALELAAPTLEAVVEVEAFGVVEVSHPIEHGLYLWQA